MPKKSKPPLGAKAAFVRANPTATAQELVALGKKQGISLTAGHVYNIRADDKRKRLAQESGGAERPVRSASSSSEQSQLDAQLRTLVIRLGLDRAEQVFTELKSSLTRMT
jgi:hypothetical protein